MIVGVLVGVLVRPGVEVFDGVRVGVGVPRGMTCLPFSVLSLRSNSMTDTAKPMLSTGLPPAAVSILDVLTPITAPSIVHERPAAVAGVYRSVRLE